MRRLLEMEWEVVAGLIAAVIALVLHFLHVSDAELLTVIAVVLIALLFVRSLRREPAEVRLREDVSRIDRRLDEIGALLPPADVVLVGPRALRRTSERFARHARGEMIWFHVCLEMFRREELFDAMVRRAIDNPDVTRVRFVLDRSQRKLWNERFGTQLRSCAGADKIEAPVWCEIAEHVSFIMSNSEESERADCLLSFWGEPFMSHEHDSDVPRYILCVQPHSELITRFAEIERRYRMAFAKP